MKIIRFALIFIILVCAPLIFQNCSEGDKESKKDITIKILQSKNWETASVIVPDNTATEGDDWANFMVSFTGTDMTASGHPPGAEVVWPTGSYTVSEDGKLITRGDGVLMNLTSISELSFTASFSLPEGTVIGGSRIAALDGDYVFNMK